MPNLTIQPGAPKPLISDEYSQTSTSSIYYFRKIEPSSIQPQTLVKPVGLQQYNRLCKHLVEDKNISKAIDKEHAFFEDLKVRALATLQKGIQLTNDPNTGCYISLLPEDVYSEGPASLTRYTEPENFITFCSANSSSFIRTLYEFALMNSSNEVFRKKACIMLISLHNNLDKQGYKFTSAYASRFCDFMTKINELNLSDKNKLDVLSEAITFFESNFSKTNDFSDVDNDCKIIEGMLEKIFENNITTYEQWSQYLKEKTEEAV